MLISLKIIVFALFDKLLDHMVYLFNILRNLRTIFHRGWTSLYSHQQCMRSSFASACFLWFFEMDNSHKCEVVFLFFFFPTPWGGISLWFWGAFPWWEVILKLILPVPVGNLCIFFGEVSSLKNFLVILMCLTQESEMLALDLY